MMSNCYHRLSGTQWSMKSDEFSLKMSVYLPGGRMLTDLHHLFMDSGQFTPQNATNMTPEGLQIAVVHFSYFCTQCQLGIHYMNECMCRKCEYPS